MRQKMLILFIVETISQYTQILNHGLLYIETNVACQLHGNFKKEFL